MTRSTIQIRSFREEDRPDCKNLLVRLPQWFGIEASNRAYLAGLSELPAAFVALRGERLVGFTSLRIHNPVSAEIEVLAVDPDFHRQGIGSELLGRLEAELRERGGFRLLHVKTLGPSEPDENYARTRAFYLSREFLPLLETTELWGPENPALILVKHMQ